VNQADVAFAGIAAQAQMLRRRELSSRELVEIYLDRITRLDPRLNAFRVVLAEQARTAADLADEALRCSEPGELLGVPVAVKDGWDVVGEVTTHGTAGGEVAAEDCEFVARLRRAGAVIIGKTNQPELAIWMFTESQTWGRTRNPWNPEVIPGGSSGGSGAAVAAGLVGAASGSDGAGSIRLPAAACGLFGLKPTTGRVPLTPYAGHWHGLTAAGCLTRNVADTALWLDVVADRAPGDRYSLEDLGLPLREAATRDPGPLRIAVSCASVTGEMPSAQISEAVTQTVKILASAGHVVEDCEPDYSDVLTTYRVRYLRGIADDYGRLAHPERVMPLTAGIAAAGERIDDAALRQARDRQAGIAARLSAVFSRYDVLLSPAVPQQPFKVAEHDDRDVQAWAAHGWTGFSGAPYLVPWNVTGQPAASVPAGFDADGLPLAVQLAARGGDEATLISVAAQLEAARGWPHARPPVS
jgi:amidase